LCERKGQADKKKLPKINKKGGGAPNEEVSYTIKRVDRKRSLIDRTEKKEKGKSPEKLFFPRRKTEPTSGLF